MTGSVSLFDRLAGSVAGFSWPLPRSPVRNAAVPVHGALRKKTGPIKVVAFGCVPTQEFAVNFFGGPIQGRVLRPPLLLDVCPSLPLRPLRERHPAMGTEAILPPLIS